MTTTIDVLLEQAQISLEELARRSELPIERIEAIVSGRWLASPVEREKLAAVFQLPPKSIDWGHFMSPRNVRYHRFGLREDIQPGSEDNDLTRPSSC